MYGNYSSKDWRRSDPTIRPSSVAMSYSQSPTTPTKTTGNDDFKLARRPVPVGKSVAALQQQHQWLMQKSTEGPSPSGSVRSSQSSIHSNNSSIQSGESPDRSSSPLILQRFATGIHQQQQHNQSDETNNSDEQQFQQQQQQQQQKQLLEEVTSNGTIRSTSDQISIMSSASTNKSPQAPPRRKPSTGALSQEGKVAHEGWFYRKNGLMQWKQVYAVAKHGNAVKPGGLYLYKDDKFSSHIQTFDMSEVVEVEPRAQEYRAGIKWEFRMLVKRDDVVFATDDITGRKVWIDALTSIMGKVSMATHSELQSRVVSADHVNRKLQSNINTLHSENEHLREQLNIIQTEVHRRQGEHSVREKELEHDLDDMQQAMDSRCELLEEELSIWRTKANGLEKELQQTKKSHKEEVAGHKKVYQDAVAKHKMEVAEWRARVEVLEKQGKQQQQTYYDYHNLATANSGTNGNSNNKRRSSTRNGSSNNYNRRRHNRRRDNYPSSSSDEEDDDGDDHHQQQASSVKDTVAEVRYNLHALREQIKSESGPLVQSHIVDIKAGVTKLNDTLEEARKGWTDLQIDIMQFFEENNNKDNKKDNVEGGTLKELNAQVLALRRELHGDELQEDTDDDNEDSESGNSKKISFGDKFDVMMQMVEMVQLSQNRLMECYLEQAEDENKGIHIDKARMEAVQFMLQELQEKLLTNSSSGGSVNIGSGALASPTNQHEEKTQEELRNAIVGHLESIMQNQQNQQSTEIISKLDEYMTAQQQSILETIKKNTNEMQVHDREEHEKNLKVLGQLLEHVINQIEASSIPDLPALSEQLEQTVNRLSVMADRLANSPIQRNFSSVTNGDDDNEQDVDGNKITTLRNGPNNNGESSSEEHQQTLQEIQDLVSGTQSFITRTLRVLEQYDNKGVEETVRRAVKSAFNSHLDVQWEQQQKTNDKDETLMKRYEENARTHFDKSMSSMRGHLEEYTGVLYRMIEDLVLRAVEHLDQQGGENSMNNVNENGNGTTDSNENNNNNARSQLHGQKTDYLIELHTKLSSTKDRLESEIERLQEEQQSLEAQVGGLKKTRTGLEKEIEEKRMALHAVKVEHETLLQNNLIEPATAALARELEPLVHQITRLKQLASFNHATSDDDSTSSSSSSGGYVDLGHMSQQQQQQQNRQHSQQYTNKSSLPSTTTENEYRGATSSTTALHAPRKFMNERRKSFDSSSTSSVGTGWKTSSSLSQQQQQQPLMSSHALSGGRTRATSPLGAILGRKS